MIDREIVRDAICKAVISRGPGPSYGDAADAAIAAVLSQLREPLSALVAFHQSGGQEGDGSDASLARIAAFLQPPDSSNPAE